MKINIRDAKIIWYFFLSYKLRCFGVLLLMLITGFLETMNLAVLYPIINYGLNLQKKDIFLQNFEKLAKYITPVNPFLSACILLIAVSVFSFIFKFLYIYFSNKLSTQIIANTQKKIFDKFMTAHYDFYIKNQQGKLIYAGTSAPEQTATAIFFTIILGYQLINSMFLFALLMFLSWQTTLFIIMLGLFYGLLTNKVIQGLINKCALIRVEENQRKNVILNEFVSGIKTIKVFLAVSEWKKRYVKAVEKGLLNQFRMMVAGALPEPLIKFIFFILIASAGIFFSKRPDNEVISLLPMLGTFVVAVNRFLPSVYMIGNAVMKIAECMPNMKIVHELCLEEFIDEVDGSETLNGFNDKIVFEKVSFKYDSMRDYLLKNLTFTIERRKVTAIVGPSGSGKTTIINLLLKLYRPESGLIAIDGKDIFALSNKTYLSRVGYVSQEIFIFNTSIKENIRFGLEHCTDRMIEEAANLANADEFIHDIPKGYDSIVGDSGVKLSGGQKQRIAIARVMLRKPEIIIFDEATSSLDNISERKIQNAISNISKYTTVLVIAHRLSTVQNADKIIILEKGEIKEQGTHEKLLTNKSLYYELHTAKDEVNEKLADGTIEQGAGIK